MQNCGNPTCRECNPQTDEMIIIIARGVQLQATDVADAVKQLTRVVDDANHRAEELAEQLAQLKELYRDQVDDGDWLFGWIDWKAAAEIIQQLELRTGRVQPAERIRGPPCRALRARISGSVQ